MSQFLRLLCLCLVAGGCDSSSSNGFAGTLISVSSTSAETGKQGRLRVTFDNPLAGDTNVMLTSTTPSVATIGDHVTVPKGAISAELAWSGVALGNTTFYATAGAATQQTSASVVDHFTVSQIYASDSTLEKGATTTVYVYLNASTPDPVQVTTAAADASIVSLPGTFTVSPWSSVSRAALNALTVGSTTISAQIGDDTVSYPVNVVDHARLTRSGSLGAQVVEVGAVVTGSISVDAVVAMPTTITATSSDATVAAAPTDVVIPTGSRSAQLRVPVMGAGSSTLSFTLADSSLDVPITAVSAIHLLSVNASTPLAIGDNTNGSLQFDAVAGAPHPVALSSSDPTILSVPAQVTLPAGSSSVSFPMSAIKSGTVTITASYGGASLPALVYVAAPNAASVIQLNWYQPTRLLVGASAQFQIYSTASTLQLTSSDPTVIAVPPSLSVPSYGYVYPYLTALKAGAATITVSSGSTSATLDLEVVTSPDMQLGPTFSLQKGMSDVGTLQFNALAPTGTYITFTSSNQAVLPSPAPVTLGSPASGASFQLMGLASGTAILTATCLGTSRTAVVWVGNGSAEPVFLQGASLSDAVLEKGAATYAQLSFSTTATSDVPITLTVSPAPVPAIAIVTDTKPILPLGENTAYIPISGNSAGTVQLTATAGGVSRLMNLTVVDKPTFSINMASNVPVGGALEGYIFSDCRLAGDHQVSLSSGDPTIATVTPATVTLTSSNNQGLFEVKGLTMGSTVINYAPTPLPSPSPMPAPITVSVN